VKVLLVLGLLLVMGASDCHAVDPSCGADGDGQVGSPCCVFSHYCAAGLTCWWTGDTALGVCDLQSTSATYDGQPCDPTIWTACFAGSACITRDGLSECHPLCDPTTYDPCKTVESGLACVVVSTSDASVGACMEAP